MRSIAAIALAFLAGAAQAQVSEVIEVRVANVDVVVLDRAGKPITGLTKDDFQLFENGKPQPLTNFYEMRSQTLAAPSEPASSAAAAAAEPPAEARKRSIIFFFDSSSVAFFARNKAIDSIQRLMSTLVRDGDDAMIVTWNRSLQVVQPFSSDRAALQHGVEVMQKRITNASVANFEKTRALDMARANINTAIETQGRYSMQRAYEDAVALWSNYATDVRNMQSGLMSSVSSLFSVLAGSDRKKVFLFLAGELQESPGMDVLAEINAMFDQAGYKPGTAAQLQAKDVGLSTQLRKLAVSASANGITMYMVDVGDRHIDDGRIRADSSVDFLSDINTLGSMGVLAETTGGAILNGTMNFDNALRDVSRDLDSYYSLGYKPAEGPKQRKIAVKVKKPGATVRTREFYSLKTADEQVGDAVVANVFHDGMTGDFPVTVEAGAAEAAAEKDTFRVAVTIKFPSNLTYLPEGEKMVGEYAVVFITASADGAMSPITKQVHKVSFPAARANEVGTQPFATKATLLVKGGTQSVSVAIVDRRGARTGFGKATFTAQ